MNHITKNIQKAVAAAVAAFAITAVQALPIAPVSGFADTAIIASAASYEPAKVTELKASSISYTSVALTWNRVSSAKGYRIYVYNSSSKKYTKVATITKNLAEYKLTGLSAGTSYKYKVRAYRKSNGSTYWGKCSDVLTLNTKSYAPAKVAWVTAKANATSWGTLKWDKVSNASGYRIYVFDPSTNKYKKVTTLSGGSKTSYDVKGLTAGTVYKYKVRAYRKVSGVTYWGKPSDAVKLRTNGTTASWVNKLNATDRAYYNFMINEFSDSDWKLMVKDMNSYIKTTFEGKSGNVKFYGSGKYFFPDRYEEYYVATPMKFAYGATSGGYLPGTSWQNEPIESYEDVLIFKSWAYANIEGTIVRLVVDGWFDDYGSAELNDIPAPIGFMYVFNKDTIVGAHYTLNVLYG